MSGICGIVDFKGGIELEKAIRKMLYVQHHRGPDSAGCLVNGLIALGHNRLRIIDLSERAFQSMNNETGTLWLICNGRMNNSRNLGTLVWNGKRRSIRDWPKPSNGRNAGYSHAEPAEFRDGVRIPLLEHGQPSSHRRRHERWKNRKQRANKKPDLYLQVVQS